jgi:hypothetical protein
MNIIFGARKHHHLARVNIFLIVVALIAGMVGCARLPIAIWNWYDLHAIRDDLGGSYFLMNDLDSNAAGYTELASEIANWGRGWEPIGTPDDPFTGSFNGQGYEIKDLFINRPDENYVGLFGLVDEGGVMENVAVVNATVAGKQHVGGLVGINEGTVTNSYYNYNQVLINGENIITIGALFGEDFEQWLASDKFLDVNQRLSQEDGYYVIDNVSDFKELLAFGQDGALKFRLTNDLDLGNEVNFYIPYLAGEFDGNAHKILNLSFDFNFVSQVGLFGYLASGGRVTQVDIENVNITGAYRVGGLVGGNDGIVRYSYSSGSVTGWYAVGGLVGINKGTVTSSHSSGSVTGWYTAGGLVGINSKTVRNSYSTGSMIGNYYVGGLVGWNDGTVTNTISTGSVAGEWDVGGLVGINYGTVSISFSTGSVTGNYYVGGLVGGNDGTVSYAHSTGSVAGDWDVGGLVGSNDGTVSISYSTGSVTGNYYVGGLGGWNEDTVSNSYSTGSVTGSFSIGGLVAINGWDGTVSNSYSSGNVTGNKYVGGLVGVNFGTASNSYSSSNVTGDEYVGGLVGVNWVGTVSNSFWDTKTSRQATSAGGTGKTTAEMQNITIFLEAAWDIWAVAPGATNFAYTWNIVHEQTYPFLSWQFVI